MFSIYQSGSVSCAVWCRDGWSLYTCRPPVVLFSPSLLLLMHPWPGYKRAVLFSPSLLALVDAPLSRLNMPAICGALPRQIYSYWWVMHHSSGIKVGWTSSCFSFQVCILCIADVIIPFINRLCVDWMLLHWLLNLTFRVGSGFTAFLCLNGKVNRESACLVKGVASLDMWWCTLIRLHHVTCQLWSGIRGVYQVCPLNLCS